MPWLAFALLSAIFDAVYYALLKKGLNTINRYVLGAGTFLCGSAILFLASLLKGLPVIGPDFYFAVFATGILNLIAAILYFKTIKIADLSLAIPMLSFTPIFLIFTSSLLLNEFPSSFGIVGIFLIVIGSYILNSRHFNTNLLAPFKEMVKNKGVLYMLVVAFLFSISSNYDKLVVQNSDQIFGTVIVYLLLGLSFFIIAFLKKEKIRPFFQTELSSFFWIGLILALGAISFNSALSLQIVPYVISLKRTGIVFSVILGALVFKEREILQRAMGAAIMLVGVIVIMLFSR